MCRSRVCRDQSSGSSRAACRRRSRYRAPCAFDHLEHFGADRFKWPAVWGPVSDEIGASEAKRCEREAYQYGHPQRAESSSPARRYCSVKRMLWPASRGKKNRSRTEGAGTVAKPLLFGPDNEEQRGQSDVSKRVKVFFVIEHSPADKEGEKRAVANVVEGQRPEKTQTAGRCMRRSFRTAVECECLEMASVDTSPPGRIVRSGRARTAKTR